MQFVITLPSIAQSAGAVEYANCTSLRGFTPQWGYLLAVVGNP